MEETALLRSEPDFAVVAKPAGIETAAEDGGPDALSQARGLLGGESLRPVHRLDRDTSGALLFARSAEAEKTLVELFRERRVEKRYLAVCAGIPFNRSGTIRRNLSEWSGGRRPVRVVKGGGGLEANTGYRVAAGNPDASRTGFESSLVVFSPRQGRTHQIRVHAAALGYPLLGDDQYGDRAINTLARERLGLRRQALHCWRLSFPWRNGEYAVACDPPADMRRAIETLFGNALEKFHPEDMS